MGLKVDQSQNNLLAYTYFHVGISIQGPIYLLSNLSFPLKLHITSFSNRQRLYDFNIILCPEHFLKMNHLMSKSLLSSFKLQIYFESSVSFSSVRFYTVNVYTYSKRCGQKHFLLKSANKFAA